MLKAIPAHLRLDTLEVESQNVVAFIKDTNFYRCITLFLYWLNSFDVTKFLSFLSNTHKLNAFNHL